MKSIGGYFGLDSRDNHQYHEKALKLNSGRNAFEWLLSNRKYKNVYIPAYCCYSLLEPLKKTDTPFTIYHVDYSLEIEGSAPQLKKDEAFLYVNYFGIKSSYVDRLYKLYGHQLIIDNSQAFFKRPVSKKVSTFYSPRKFFGVSDGGYLYSSGITDEGLKQEVSYDRMMHLLIRIDSSPEDGFETYKKNEQLIIERPVSRISSITSSILSNINYKKIREIRKRNFIYLNDGLAALNLLQLCDIKNYEPMVYPLLIDKPGLRQYLIDQKIYCAQYWPKTIGNLSDKELFIRASLLPLPIDQRYGFEDMQRIINTVKEYANNY